MNDDDRERVPCSLAQVNDLAESLLAYSSLIRRKEMASTRKHVCYCGKNEAIYWVSNEKS